jgi:hypothetical protein
VNGGTGPTVRPGSVGSPSPWLCRVNSSGLTEAGYRRQFLCSRPL